MRFSSLPKTSVLLVGAFLTASLLLPLPYAVISPGRGTNVMDSVIDIAGAPTFPSTGKLLITTVMATSPSSPIFGLDVVYSWAKGESIVMPRSVLYPPEQSAKQITAAATKDMKDSQSYAADAAFSFLGFAKDQTTVTATISVKDTGGPSGGLIFALGIIEKLTSEDLLAGRVIAGTGTIDPSGKVGPIGGIDEKLIAAKRSGATIFLAPSDNCEDVHHIPAGLSVYSVSTLKEAVKVLQNVKNSIPHCTWQ